MQAATFYTDIGFATKLNYVAFTEKHPKESKELQTIIDKHYSQMKTECQFFVRKHRTAIYLVEEQRKEEFRRNKIAAEETKLQMQKERWASEITQSPQISNDSIAGLTQATPIPIDDVTSEMELLKIGFQAQVAELRGYALFLESKCTQLGLENFELEKLNFKLTEENKKLKHKLGDELKRKTTRFE